MSRAGRGGLALVAAAAGLFIAQAYPLHPVIVVALFIGWAVLAALRLPYAIAGTLALMPIVGLAPITGWLTFEEFDLLVLATAAGGYAGLAVRPDAGDARPSNTAFGMPSIFSIALMVLFLASTAIALERGMSAAGPFRFDWTQGYDEPLNSLRLFKSFAFALLLMPLLSDVLRRPRGIDDIGTGLTAALGLGAIAVLQERLAFTGLLDFSDDYRVTGSFWEMHVGGAALDGFLALTIPFAVREALKDAHWGRFVAAGGVLALAAYASFVTFSRGVYLAVPISLLLLVVLVFRQRLRLDRGAMWPVLAKGAVFAALVAVAGFIVFRGGGYRAVLAVFAVLALAIPLEASLRRMRPATGLAAVIAAALLTGVGMLLAGAVPKGPYVMFALAFVACAAAVWQAEQTGRSTFALFSLAAWLWMAASACLVAGHWGGSAALRDSTIVVAVLVIAAFVLSRLRTSLWPAGRREQLATVGFAALVMGSIAVFTAGAYMGGRFSTSKSDLDSRLAHWSSGLARMHGADWLVGAGLGRFPATSLFDSFDATRPGSHRVVRRNGETFLALSGPAIKYLGFGELFRVSQRVSIQPGTRYVLTVEARSATQIGLHLEVCEKLLLYHGDCVIADPQMPGGLDTWKTVSVAFPDMRGIGASRWYAPKPVFFAVAVGNPGSVVEIRRIRLIGPGGVDAIANGDFSERLLHWFSSSDKFHLPWHMKNIALHVLFDQGVVGLVLFALLIGGALLRVTVGRARRHPDAPYVAAALVGFLIVGAFDSLLDVPRVAFAFYVVALIGFMLRNPRLARIGPAPEPVAAPVEADDARRARERAERRQKAFGERMPDQSRPRRT